MGYGSNKAKSSMLFSLAGIRNGFDFAPTGLGILVVTLA
jgi:hypothetical protein